VVGVRPRASAFLQAFTNRLPSGGEGNHPRGVNGELRIRILHTLERLAAPDLPPRDMPGILRELDALAGDPASDIPGDLRHYLCRRSYEKARLFLAASGPIPPGDCGRGSR